MGFMNRMVKGTFYVVLALFMLSQSYLFGLLFSGAIIAVVMAVWSIIKPLPELFVHKAWLVYILSGIPTGLYVFVFMLVDLIKGNSKKHNKQDNGNN